jgi:ATP-dependent RNA helicase SUPV3L1/SUV3
LTDEHLAASDRERLVERLDAWLQAELHGKLKPLILLSEASDLSGLARGLAYQLTENLGVLRRDAASEQIKALDQAARAQLRKYGVRFGAFNVYIPALLAGGGRFVAAVVVAPFRPRSRPRR